MQGIFSIVGVAMFTTTFVIAISLEGCGSKEEEPEFMPTSRCDVKGQYSEGEVNDDFCYQYEKYPPGDVDKHKESCASLNSSKWTSTWSEEICAGPEVPHCVAPERSDESVFKIFYTSTGELTDEEVSGQKSACKIFLGTYVSAE